MLRTRPTLVGSPAGDVVMSRVSKGFWLSDHRGDAGERFATCETVFVAGRGLDPGASYDFELVDARGHGKPELLARYAVDRHGVLPTSVLLPRFGLARGEGLSRRTLTEMLTAHAEREYVVRAAHCGNRQLARHDLRLILTSPGDAPRLFSCDSEGRLQSGLEQGRGHVAVALHRFPAGCVRVFVVPRQFGWRVGDPIERVRIGDVSSVRTIDHDGSPWRLVTLARGTDLAPGSYQFIARAFRPGWWDAEEPTLLESDVVSDHRFASLVVRWPFRGRFDFDNGVVLTPEIAGRPLAHRPYFRFINNFPKGTDVYAALDPDALPAGLVSQRAAIYVIRHKSAAEWAAGNALDDISGPGMTAAPKIVPIVPGCVNWNETLVWPNPQTPGRYDIAIDFGNNAALPADFVTDGTLDAPLDMIDGYVRVGFYITEDPSLPGPYAGKIGQHDYALGTIQVPSTDTGPTPTDSLPLTATIRYPAQSAGIDAACAVGAFPLVVLMHGNSGYDTSYLGYNYLLDHLASHGFIAMSIYAPVGVMIETRARAILAHLATMATNNSSPGLFHGHVDLANIGIGGHSRGGEAVVRAARINTAEGLGWSLKAGVSIAPTDYHHYGDPGIPLVVIYGANDGDVAGTWPDRTCFNIYDEAGRPRSFVFVYGATHDQFNTVWAPTFLTVESDIAPGDVANLISLSDHENVAKGYVTALMQARLQGRIEQLEYFSTSLRPSLTAGLRIHTSHQEPGSRLLDDFEQTPHDANFNSMGGAVSALSLSGEAEGALRTLDIHSPHVTSGGKLAWQSSAAVYLSNVPSTARDLSAFSVLGFRVTQTYASALNPPNQAQDLFVRLTDGGGKSRAIRASTFTDIPYPYLRGHADLIKSALKSVRIPLASYVIANLGAQDVDLTNVQSISFEFSAASSGEIEIDDIEFSA
jgi:dienelactone hydrolase